MGDYYRIFGTMYGESGDYRRIDRGYIPCVAEVEFQIIEKFPGDFSGDEDTTFPGSDVLPMVVSAVCDWSEWVNLGQDVIDRTGTFTMQFAPESQYVFEDKEVGEQTEYQVSGLMPNHRYPSTP